jgi:hypothetical protein
MPKHNHNVDQVHFFINEALTSSSANLSNYKKEEFKVRVRIVAIESILALLQSINSAQMWAQSHDQVFDVENAINIVNPITGLNMLDYCLVAGFDDFAIQLIRLGATSSHIDSLQKNISHTFGEEHELPDIMHNINSIISNLIEIKRNCDQIVAKTNDLMPRLISFGNKIVKGYNIPTLIALGMGCVFLAPVLHPMAHGVGAAIMLSAGLVPGVVSGLSIDNHSALDRNLIVNDQDATLVVKGLLHLAKDTRYELKKNYARSEAHECKHRPKKHLLDKHAQVSLVHQLNLARRKNNQHETKMQDSMHKSFGVG